MIPTCSFQQTEFEVGSKSLQGRGGMGAKVDAAMKYVLSLPSLCLFLPCVTVIFFHFFCRAIRGGVPAVVIAPGGHPDTISKILAGEEWGTLFIG
jgi:glutamate 5-kinase